MGKSKRLFPKKALLSTEIERRRGGISSSNSLRKGRSRRGRLLLTGEKGKGGGESRILGEKDTTPLYTQEERLKKCLAFGGTILVTDIQSAARSREDRQAEREGGSSLRTNRHRMDREERVFHPRRKEELIRYGGESLFRGGGWGGGNRSSRGMRKESVYLKKK